MRATLLVSIAAAAGLVACSPAIQPVPAPTPLPAGTSPQRGLAQQGELTGADRARQALNRLTFGARPGDVDAIMRMGVDTWIERQLYPERVPDPVGDSVLRHVDPANMSALELVAVHPTGDQVLLPQTARTPDTQIRKPRVKGSALEQLADLRAQVDKENEASTKSNRLYQESYAVQQEVAPAILLRDTYSDRQLLEVLTGFWENHFSVFVDKMPHPYALVDLDHAIHAHALGKFRDLLGAVATTPAMLFYLDNSASAADSSTPGTIDMRIEAIRAMHPPLGDTSLVHLPNPRRTGTNENYARELMELHTLGVDGGFTQKDVQEVARCFTGWGIDNPTYGGEFAFHTDLHDPGVKHVLGVTIPAGRGVQDGNEVLDILARSPSTAHFISTKLVRFFVSDDPPPALVKRAADTYMRTGGDIREVMRTIVTSPEFFSRRAYRSKAKTPYDLVVSTLRVMNATPDTTGRTVQTIATLGQRMFGHVTPEGWPDQGESWLNLGAMLDRVQFSMQVEHGQVPNVTVAKWKMTDSLMHLPLEAQVDGVIRAILGGDASTVTREAMLEILTPSATPAHIGELIAIAIGSAEFQSR